MTKSFTFTGAVAATGMDPEQPVKAKPQTVTGSTDSLPRLAQRLKLALGIPGTARSPTTVSEVKTCGVQRNFHT